MKRIIATLAITSILGINVAQAQIVKQELIHTIQASVNFGFTTAYTDAKFPQTQFATNIAAHYFPYPFLSINPSIEFGRLAAGDAASSTAANREFVNKFTGGNLTVRIFPLKLFLDNTGNNKYFNSVYAGGGIGFISSNLYADPIGNGFLQLPEKSGTTYPVEFGINVPVYQQPSGVGQVMANINYRYYYTNTDDIDGYRPTVSANLHNDVYSFLSLGIVYQFN